MIFGWVLWAKTACSKCALIGDDKLQAALDAGLLLAVNVVCVNLSSKIVFSINGIRPRTWYEKRKAKRAMTVYILGWLAILVILMLVIYVREYLAR